MRQKIINQVNEEIIKLTTRRTIPSYIFLDLSHQIVSRLGTNSDGDNKFGAVLEALVNATRGHRDRLALDPKAIHDFRLRFEDEGSLEDEEAMEW